MKEIINVDDLINLKEELVTHYCFVHDEEMKQKIENAGFPQIKIKVSQYVEKGKVILVDKNLFEPIIYAPNNTEYDRR